MKRLFLIALAMLLAVALTASAQEAKKMHFGITGGVSMGNWSGSDAAAPSGVDKKMRTGFAGGAFADFTLSKSFVLSPQVLYVMKGVKYESGGVSATEKLDYLEVPVLIKWAPEMQGKMQATIFAGPHLGFLMTAKEEDVDTKDLFKSTDFGITFGAGLGTKMTSGELFFDVRLDLGMSKIVDMDPEVNVKNTTFMGLIGYRFGN